MVGARGSGNGKGLVGVVGGGRGMVGGLFPSGSDYILEILNGWPSGVVRRSMCTET